MSADPPGSQANHERNRQWITDIQVTPGNSNPSCKFSARVFIDDELVCNLPAIDGTRPLQWSGLLFCDVSPAATVALRLCRNANGRPRYFNFPPFTISEADEETGEATLELAEAVWVVTINCLTPALANDQFPDELERFDAVEGVYDSLQPEATVKYLFKHALQFASLVVRALPESTAKVSFLVYMKAWELLDQQTQIDDTVRAVLKGLIRIRDIIDIVNQASSSMLATAMSQSKEAIHGLLGLLEGASVYIFNRYTTNDLARVPPGEAEDNNPFDAAAYLICLEDLQKALYSSWWPASGVLPDTSQVEEDDTRSTSDPSSKTDWYEIVNLLRPINPSGYDPDQACLDGTREALLNKVITWSQNRESPESLMWISGQAGMGKTSVATSLCQRLDSIRALGGGFFCRRDDPNCNEPLALINNLVCELAMNCPAYAREVAIAIQANPKLCYSHLSLRYQGLIIKPLEKLARITMPTTLVVVVDGLDECGDHRTRGRTLQQLYVMSKLVPWLKVVFTGRPVADLQKYFQTDGPLGTVVHLHDYDASPDIRAYIEGELGQLATTERWPEGSIDGLCTMAQGVFLWAKVATESLKELTVPALPRLRKILGNQKSPVTDHFDTLYTKAIEMAMGKNQNESRGPYLQCIGSILAISEREPLSAPDLQYLLLVAGRIDQPTLEQTLQHLSPLLHVMDGQRIRFHHPSFKHFVTDASRAGQFHVRLDQYEAQPAACCLQVMQRDLRFNICKLETSHQLNSEVHDMKDRIDTCIGPALKYACTHWIDHFIASPSQALVQTIKVFMEGPQLLYWIEALSLLGRIDLAIAGLSKLTTLNLTRFNSWDLIESWAKDAHRLILSFYNAVTISTPHLYISALAFAPRESLTALRIRPNFPNTITFAGGGDLVWHPCIKATVHPDAVQTLSISPDGTRLAAGYPDGSLAIWDNQTGACVSKSLVGHRDVVTCTAFSPSGNVVASSSHDATIRLWNITNHLQNSRVLSGHSGPVHSVAFSPSGTVIASGSSDRTIRLWDPITMRLIHEPYVGHSNRITSVAFSPDGTKLVSGSWDKTIRVWSLDLGSSRLANNPLVINGHPDSVTCVVFSPDGATIASGSVDKTVQLWDAQTGAKSESHASPSKHSDNITSIAFSPDGKYAASCSLDGVIQLWDPTTPTYIQTFGHRSPVNAITFTPDGSYIVSGSTDMTTRVWEIDSCSKLTTMHVGPLVGHSSAVRSIVVTGNGTRIVSASEDKTVRIWDAQAGVPIGNPLNGHSNAVHGVAISPDGTRIVSGSAEGSMRLWDTATHTNINSYQCSYSIYCIAFSPDGAQIAFGTADKNVYLWDLAGWKMINGALQGHSQAVLSVAFSPDGSCVASASDDRTVILWDVRTHTRCGTPLSGHTGGVRSVAFSPCGTRLVSGSLDNIVRVWDRQTGNTIHTLTGHSHYVMAVAFSPDGSCIASGSYDKTVRLWNAKTSQPIGQPLTEHSHYVHSIAFSPDSNYLISGSQDNAIRVRSIACFYPVVEPENEPPSIFCWPTNPYELSLLPNHPGWVAHNYQSLAFWLPAHYEQPDMFLGPIQRAPRPPVCLNYSKLVHGTDWTRVASDAIRNGSS